MARRSIAKEAEALRQRLGTRPIVLVGLMGAGKTSVGRRLAEKLGIPFVDADHEIEAAAGKSIAEIFADHGEPYFREGERRVIQRLIGNGAQVLATGGGAYMNDETRAAHPGAWHIGLAQGLAAVADEARVKRQDRPLLKTEDPEAVMRELIEKRYPVYAQADVTVESRDVQHGQMVNDVIRALAQWNGWDELEG